MDISFDIIVVGSGPGGYVAAIRASQLGFKVAVIERAELGGICLNWGCIPTKALLKSAAVFKYLKHATDYGISINGETKADFEAIVKSSRGVAEGMSKGIQFLFKKNKITVINGTACLKPGKKVEVTEAGWQKNLYEAKHIIIATGGRSKELPGLKQDGKKIISYREAMTLPSQPQRMVVVGSGAIGTEFAYFYQTLGTQVTLVEFLPNILPIEDEEISKLLDRSFKKAGMKILTDSAVENVIVEDDLCKVNIRTPKGMQTVECDIVLSAVGVVANIENIGLEDCGISTTYGKIDTDACYRTNVEGYYAIGDVVKGPALAHVASAEGIICIEHIAGLKPEPLDYGNIPGCTYSSPEVASVGLTEKKALEAGYEIKVGKFPFTASGKAMASGARDGMIKVIFNAADGQWLGAHFIGENVTEMIAGVVTARKMKATGHDILKAVHPHPTMSEAIMEAVAAAYGEVIHL